MSPTAVGSERGVRNKKAGLVPTHIFVYARHLRRKLGRRVGTKVGICSVLCHYAKGNLTEWRLLQLGFHGLKQQSFALDGRLFHGAYAVAYEVGVVVAMGHEGA